MIERLTVEREEYEYDILDVPKCHALLTCDPFRIVLAKQLPQLVELLQLVSIEVLVFVESQRRHRHGCRRRCCRIEWEVKNKQKNSTTNQASLLEFKKIDF